jgi:hypothetical protein
MRIKDIFKENVVLYILILFFTGFFAACNQDEGLGGSSSIEGYVYNVVHQDDNYSFRTDTFPAAGKKVYISFGDDTSVGEDTDAGQNGYYRFDYLREGNYKVYALSESQFGEKTPVVQSVNVGKGASLAPAVYIHSGDAYNTTMIQGKVYVTYYHKDDLVTIDGKSEFSAVDIRVYIKNSGEPTAFDDVRTGDRGVFIFKELQTDKQYEVFVHTEIQGDEYKNILFPLLKTVNVREAHKIYPLDDEPQLEFHIVINN